MVDLTKTPEGKPQARLLDLAPGRSGTVYANWLTGRGPDFADTVKIAPLDPFRGYANAIDDPSTTASRTPSRSWMPSTWSGSD